MKKKSSEAFDGKISSIKTAAAAVAIASDGIYYYCSFTAIAAECGEYLGDHEMARLAYKSVKAMEDKRCRRKKKVGSTYCSVGVGVGVGSSVYNSGTSDGDSDENRSIVNDCNNKNNRVSPYIHLKGPTITVPTTSSASIPMEGFNGGGDSLKITITKTPANTPNAIIRKKQKHGTAATAASDGVGVSSWVAMAARNKRSANTTTTTTRRNNNFLFSPVSSSSPKFGGGNSAMHTTYFS